MKLKEKKVIPLKTVFKYFVKTFSRKQKIMYVLVLFFQIVRSSSFVIAPLYFKKIFDYMALHSSDMSPEIFNYILSILIILIVIRVVAWTASRGIMLLLLNLQPELNYQVKNDAYEYLMKHSYTFFTNNFIGGLTHKINKYTDAIWNITDKIVHDFMVLFVKVSGILIALFFIDKRLFFGMFIFLFVFLVVSLKLSQKRKPISLKRAVTATQTNSYMSDSLSNQNSVLLFSAHTFELNVFKSVAMQFLYAMRKRFIFDSVVGAVYSGFILVAELALVGLALYYWSLGQTTLGTVILIQTYIIGLIDDIWGFSRTIQTVEEAYSDAREMVEILETPHEVQDVPGAKELTVREGKIVFDKVTFSYNENNEALSDLNVEITPGQKVGLIGPSGAGKSTFVKLLLRFFDVSGGSIQIDGQDIRDVTQDSLHSAIGFVPQDPALFHRSLMDNIRYGRRDATDEEVIEASQKAHAHEFISKLPEGYNTLVGERGIKLSGGERQRVAIARAILKNAPILVLDEATSALDSESERLIQDALNILMEGKTVIVIAHRLSTIQHMDRILVIDDGKITEDGDHKKLLKNKKSLYKKLWDLQAGGFIN